MIKLKQNIIFYSLILIIIISAHFNSTEILFANGKINYQFKESYPFKVGYGTTPQSPTTGNLKISLKVNYIDTQKPMTRGNVSFMAKGDNQIGYSITKQMTETIEMGHYHSNFEIPYEGMWEFKFTIDDGMQKETIAFQRLVSKPEPYQGVLTSIALIVFIIILSLTVRTIIKNKSNNTSSS